MARKGTRKANGGVRIKGLTKKGTFEIGEDYATKLEIYAKSDMFGPKNSMVQEGLRLFFEANSMPKDIYKACETIVLRERRD